MQTKSNRGTDFELDYKIQDNVFVARIWDIWTQTFPFGIEEALVEVADTVMDRFSKAWSKAANLELDINVESRTVKFILTK